MPLDILILAVVAMALLWKLWSVLGTRNEDEIQRPNPFIPPMPPPRTMDEPFAGRAPVALPAASVAGGLAQVAASDPAFNEKQFLLEARQDFTVIVETYAGGDLTAIATLVAPALLAHFQQAADARKAAGQSAYSRVVSIRDADCVAARAEGAQAFITVKFISIQENILRDGSGAVIGGSIGKSDEVTDIWVFARDTAQADSKWIVTETQG